MSELQATLELVVELHKFYNVDLFQRGVYQVRVALRTSPKIPTKVEVSLHRVTSPHPHNHPSNGPRTVSTSSPSVAAEGSSAPKTAETSDERAASSSASLASTAIARPANILFPACVVNGSAVSQTFQILYRSEEVALDDVIHYRLHVLVDSHKIEETLERLDAQLTLELWFAEQGFGPAVSETTPTIAPVSVRTLQLHLSPSRGLHYHLPVLFDYFHLGAVALTIHASLVTLHQPYIKRSVRHLVQSCAPRSNRSWMHSSRSVARYPESTLESVFFGTLATSKCGGGHGSGGPLTGWRLAHARQVHRDVCSLLLAAGDSLRANLDKFMALLPPWQRAPLQPSDCAGRLHGMSELAQVVDSEEDFVAMANADIAQLCAENILLWRMVADTFPGSNPVREFLAQQHHTQRVKRFAEAFYVVENPRHSAAGCYDANVQTYLYVSDALRKSRYLSSLPPLPAHCPELNGDFTSLPIIFEDRYQDSVEYARRISWGNQCLNQTPNAEPSKWEKSPESLTESPATRRDNVTNGDAADIISTSSTTITTPYSSASLPRRSTRKDDQSNPVYEELSECVLRAKSCAVSSPGGGATPAGLHIQRGRSLSHSRAQNGSKSPKGQVRNETLQMLRRLAAAHAGRDPSHHAVGDITLEQLVAYLRAVELSIAASKSSSPVAKSVSVQATPSELSPPPLPNPVDGPKPVLASINGVAHGRRRSYAAGDTNHMVPPALPQRNSIKTTESLLAPLQIPNPVLSGVSTVSTSKSKSRSRCSTLDSISQKKRHRLRHKIKLNPASNRGSHAPVTSSPKQKPGVVLLGYKPLESSRSLPFDLKNHARGVGSVNTPIRATKSAVLPSAAESLPDLSSVWAWALACPRPYAPPPPAPPGGHSFSDPVLTSPLLVVEHQPIPAQGTLSTGRRRSSQGTGGVSPTISPGPASTSGLGSLVGSECGTGNRSRSQRLDDTQSTSDSTPSDARKAPIWRDSSIRAPGFGFVEGASLNGKDRDEESLSKSKREAKHALISKEKKLEPMKRDLTEKKSDSSSLSDMSSERSGWISHSSHCPSSEEVSSTQLSPIEDKPRPSIPLEPIPKSSSACVAHVTLEWQQSLEETLPEWQTTLAPPKEFQDPPLATPTVKEGLENGLEAKYEKHEVPTGVPGIYRRLQEDGTPLNVETLLGPRPATQGHVITQQELRLLQLLLRELHKPGPPNPLIQALAQSIAESLSLALGPPPDATLGERIQERPSSPLLLHSASQPCLLPVTSSQIDSSTSTSTSQTLVPSIARAGMVTSAKGVGVSSKADKCAMGLRTVSLSSLPMGSHISSPRMFRLETTVDAAYSLDERDHNERHLLTRRKCSCASTLLLSGSEEEWDKQRNGGQGETADGGVDNEEKLRQRLVSMLGDGTLSFLKAKEDFKRQINFAGMLYSERGRLASALPYFHISEDYRPFSPDGLHLIVCVHGLDGNSADLRLVKTYLELALPGANLDFLMSERNQGGTFSTFEAMTDRLVSEILYHIEAYGLAPARISFIGHSLGTIIIRSALTRPQMRPWLPRLHTFLSLSGPHLGTLYNNSGLVNMGLWLMQRWKKSGSLLQLSLKDADDPRDSFLCRLARQSELHRFQNVVLCGSAQDRYVPLHSARIELCRGAVRDTSALGLAYQEMVQHIMQPIIASPTVRLVRYDIHHALPSTANTLIGRAAHIAVLDSELFIEKFLLVAGVRYFI